MRETTPMQSLDHFCDFLHPSTNKNSGTITKMSNIQDFDIDIFPEEMQQDQSSQKTKETSEPVAKIGAMASQNPIDLPILPGPPSNTPVGPRTQIQTAAHTRMPQGTQRNHQSHYSNYTQNNRNHATRPPNSYGGRGARGMPQQIPHMKEKIFCTRCSKDDHRLKDCVNCSHDGYMDGCPKCRTLDHHFFKCHIASKPNGEYHFTRHCRRNRPPWRLMKDHRDCRKTLDGKDMSDPDDIPWTVEFSKRNINSVLSRTVVDPASQNYDSVPTQISEAQQYHIPGFSKQWNWDQKKFTTPANRPSPIGRFRRPSNQDQDDGYGGSYYADDEVPGYIPDGTEDDTDWPSKDLVVKEWTMQQEKVRSSIPRPPPQLPSSSAQAINISIKKRGISITSGDARIQIDVDGNESMYAMPEIDNSRVLRKRKSNELALEDSRHKRTRPMEDASIDINVLNQVKDRVNSSQSRVDFMEIDSTQPTAPRRQMPGSENMESSRRCMPGSEDIEPIAPRRRMPGSTNTGPPRRRMPGSEYIDIDERDEERQPDTIKYLAGTMGDYQVYKKCTKCGSTEHLSYHTACPLHRSNQK